MNFTSFKLPLCLMFALCLSAKSVAAPIAVTGGDTFVQIDVNVMRSIGLSIDSVSGADLLKMPGFIAFGMNSQAADPATTFVFDSENFSPVSGAIQHTGSITFGGTPIGVVTLGDFEFSDYNSDPAGASRLVLRNTLFEDEVNNFPIFDLAPVGGGPSETSLSYDDDSLSTDGPILVSPELAAFLGQPALAGAVAGSAKISAQAVIVPEPSSLALALLAFVGVSVIIARQ